MPSKSPAKNYIFHPLLFAWLPTLSLFSHNIRSTSVGQIFLPAALSITLALLLWLLFWLFCRRTHNAAAVVSLFIFLFFSYGPARETIRFLVPVLSFSGIDRLLLPFWLVLFLLGAYLIIKIRRSFYQLTMVLNIIAFCLVSLALARIALYAGKNYLGRSWRYDPDLSGAALASFTPTDTGPAPDIYYIILDAYARADILRDYFQFDNSEFITYLSNKGFYLPRLTHSNYCQTCLSLASSLNMTYHHDLAACLGPDTGNVLPLKGMIQDSRLFRFLKEHNYRIITFASGYPMTEIKDSDGYFSPGWVLDDFQGEILNRTPVPTLQYLFKLPPSRCKRILYVFDRLAQLPRQPGPVLVFAHIVAPHHPFVFGPQGQILLTCRPDRFSDTPANEGQRQEYIRRYIDQLIFINRQTQTLIDRILSQSRYPPIIIIQADHGPASTLDWDNPSQSAFRERFAILNAYYLPSFDYADLYDDLSPVNTFRIVLNHYFQTGLPLLPDESYFSPVIHPYRLNNVTSLIE